LEAVILPQRKRVAVFLDGTWNIVDDNTNVWRIKSLCAPNDIDQITYYDEGVGTQVGQKIIGGMFGYGLDQEITDAYEWLIENYDTDDELFIFGFSRGAYTARALSGFISKCGLLQPGAPLGVKQLYDRYRLTKGVRTIRELARDKASNPDGSFTLEEAWMLEYSMPVPIKFVGVWDTVGALGIPFGNIPVISRKDYQFLETDLRINNDFAYHALAIDEHRKAFAPTLWTRTVSKDGPPDASYPTRPIEAVEQRWFVGAHANVGGGYMSDLLAQIPLRWLMSKASGHGLRFRKDIRIDGDEIKAPVCDSYSEFLYGAYRIMTLNRPYYRPIGRGPVTSASGNVITTINETIDSSVFERWKGDTSYRPPNLADWEKVYSVDIGSLNGSVRADHPSEAVPS